MLVSIQLNSNRPDNISEFVANVNSTASKPSDIEIIFHIDKGDEACRSLLEKLKITSQAKIKYLETDIIKHYKDLWKPLNEILKITDPQAYFITNFSDEFIFETKGWDDILRQYIGYFEDDVFRIRLSRYRFRNYTDSWECVYAPDSLAFYTKKWMDIVGMWCPCLGPDSWQQLVAFYLINARKFDHIQYNRDLADPFIKFSGEGASVGLTGLKARQRIKDNVDLWFETVSHEMQEKAKYAAAKLQTAIIMYDNSYNQNNITYNFRSNQKPPMFDGKKIKEINYKNNEEEKRIEFYHENNLIYKISYKLNKFKLFIINNLRKPNYGYYAGGGKECLRKDIITQINVYLRMRKYGTFNSKTIISKPRFFKRNPLLKLLWAPIKIILVIAIITKYYLFRLTKTQRFYRYFRYLNYKLMNNLSYFSYNKSGLMRNMQNHSLDFKGRKFSEIKRIKKRNIFRNKKWGFLWPVVKIILMFSLLTLSIVKFFKKILCRIFPYFG